MRQLPSPPAATVARVLAWYAGTPLLRALVQRLPFGTGSALDAALLGTLPSLTGAPRILPPGKRGPDR